MLLSELPFQSVNSPGECSVEELLEGNLSTNKLPLDGLIDFHSVRFASANAKETARIMEYAFGLQEVAYRGLETGSKYLASHVVRSAGVVFEIVNSLGCGGLHLQRTGAHKQQHQLLDDAIQSQMVSDFVNKHGMGVIDVAFTVVDTDSSHKKAVTAGALSIKEPTIETDKYGSVKYAIVRVPETDFLHTFVQNVDYKGPYLPGFQHSGLSIKLGENSGLNSIDHFVQNHNWNLMMPYARFYAAAFGLHKFWSVDDKDIYTGNTALKSIVMASTNGKIKMPINEPAHGLMKSQIEEFYEFYNGPGIQHVAIKTYDILMSVSELRDRGVEFNSVSDEYYRTLDARLKQHSITLMEPFEELKANHILVDFDLSSKFKLSNGTCCCNYILQIFTKPVHDRPTFFFEIIQRRHHNGFGKGTFKGLFESIELQQKMRGTLVPSDN